MKRIIAFAACLLLPPLLTLAAMLIAFQMGLAR